MDSLPEQHIEDLAGATRKEAYRRIGILCLLRGQRTYSEDEIAEKAEFGTAEGMHHQLKIWGLTGLLPPEKEEQASGPRAPKETRKRKARGGSGPVVELPPASKATPLFREKLETLLRAADELKFRKEKRQGKRFISSSVHTLPDSDVFAWSLGEATPAPQPPLPALIAAYVLAGGDAEPLVELLHDDPESAEWPKIKKHIEGRKTADGLDGLKTSAEQLATLIRGGSLGDGAPPVGLSRHEVNLAARIEEARRHNPQASARERYEDLLRRLGLTEEQFSWDEFRRLADFEQEWPFT